MSRRRKKVTVAKETSKKLGYDDALRAGSSIGKIVTDIWNSQKKPGKVYIFNRRVHHGEIGTLLGLSNLFKKLRPETAGILSGLGDALSKDDIADKEEWFKFKKRENDTCSEISSSEADHKGDQNQKQGRKEGNIR